MAKEKEFLTIIDDKGNEKVATIILTHEKNGVNYVVFEVEAEDIISAGRYDETSGEEGFINDIETEEEWEMIQDLLDDYFDSLEQSDKDDE